MSLEKIVRCYLLLNMYFSIKLVFLLLCYLSPNFSSELHNSSKTEQVVEVCLHVPSPSSALPPGMESSLRWYHRWTIVMWQFFISTFMPFPKCLMFKTIQRVVFSITFILMSNGWWIMCIKKVFGPGVLVHGTT